MLILSFLTTVQLILKNREIKKNKKVTSPMGFEATKHLRNRMQRKLPKTPLNEIRIVHPPIRRERVGGFVTVENK